MRRNLDRQLADFLRKERGALSYAEFARRVGLSHTTLHRIERGEHHLTLNKLETVLTDVEMKDLITAIDTQKASMIAVATGGPRINEVNREYEAR